MLEFFSYSFCFFSNLSSNHQWLNSKLNSTIYLYSRNKEMTMKLIIWKNYTSFLQENRKHFRGRDFFGLNESILIMDCKKVHSILENACKLKFKKSTFMELLKIAILHYFSCSKEYIYSIKSIFSNDIYHRSPTPYWVVS